jgi:hypothetical protein
MSRNDPGTDNGPHRDVSPAATPKHTKPTQESFNDPMNDCNKPVPLRKGGPDENGWMHEAYDVNHDEEI